MTVNEITPVIINLDVRPDRSVYHTTMRCPGVDEGSVVTHRAAAANMGFRQCTASACLEQEWYWAEGESDDVVLSKLPPID